MNGNKGVVRVYEYGRKFIKTVSVLLLVVLAVLMTGFSKPEAKVQNQKLTLNVALFPYVPDRARFQEIVSDVWKREHPDVDLHFADWDCYASDPDPFLDVFVFDGVYLSSFVKEIVMSRDDRVFRMGPDARRFIAEMETVLRERIGSGS